MYLNICVDSPGIIFSTPSGARCCLRWRTGKVVGDQFLPGDFMKKIFDALCLAPVGFQVEARFLL